MARKKEDLPVEEMNEELEALKQENEALLKKVIRPPVYKEDAVYIKPNGDSFDVKYVNENYPERVKAVIAAGFLPEAQAKKAK